MSKIKLVENVAISPNEYKKRDSLTEKYQTLTIEEKSGKTTTYKAKAVYTFPISKPDSKNLNERVYSSKLWENVIKNKYGENSYGLMDHPENEGSTKDRWCVWRNLRFSEDKKTILADAYLFGKWGQEVLEGLEAGGKVGLSTSGYGELLEDDQTVNPESYELERVADFVFNPSYEVFGTKEDKLEVETEEEKPSEEKEEIVEENEKENKKEKSSMEKNKKISSFEEKSFKINMMSSFKEAKKIESLDERIENLNELLSYFEEGIAEDLKKEIQEALDSDLAKKEEFAKKGESFDKIEGENKTLQEQLDSLKNDFEELKKEKESLETKFKNATDLLDSTKVYTNKLQEMYDLVESEKNGMISASEYNETLAFIEDLEKEKEDLKEENLKLSKKFSTIERRKKRARSLKREEIKENEEEEVEDLEEEEENYDGVNKEVLQYYREQENSNPDVSKIKNEILRSRTLFEAQMTYMKLKGLVENDSNYDRRVTREKNTFAESDRQSLNIRKGWL